MPLSSPCLLDITEYRLRFSRELQPAEATQLRGFFGTAFAEEVLLHHHEAEGGLRYDYPRVQFKVLGRVACLIGNGEGGAVVERLWREVDQARIGNEELPVVESSLLRRRERFGESPQSLNYRFLSPWMGLNQVNYHRYCELSEEAARQQLLARILVGNCLSLAKSFGYRVAIRLEADVSQLRETCARLKGVPMVTFRGTFRVNFHLPAWLGIGKSVSRGFGTVEPME